ncbi:unnamed protein product [Dovyalis caffra]|uniref:Uncharacterized protein n=1 Tax=Dovyalis caffra TaxID=77055 RepID=A0AAV1QUY5_9ROSI|nr:unnamed protein product [Dovyalis caffra]
MKLRLLESMRNSMERNITSSTCLTTGSNTLKQQGVTDLSKWNCLWVTVAWGRCRQVKFHNFGESIYEKKVLHKIGGSSWPGQCHGQTQRRRSETLDLKLEGAPGPCSSATHGRRLKIPAASCYIKLIRTDTTLDLSQKAEKGAKGVPFVAYTNCLSDKEAKQQKPFDLKLEGAPGPCSSATHRRRSKIPIASYCNGPSPSKN